MKKLMITLIWIAGGVITAVFAGLSALFVFLLVTEYNPEPVLETGFSGSSVPLPEGKRSFSCISWNTGYAGLGKEMDFFYEGGTMVKPDKEQSKRYLEGIMERLASSDTCDFIMLQEVDRNSRRSYYLDQVNVYASLLAGYGAAYASNYNVRFVPVPVLNPMGKTESGIVTFSRFTPSGSTRYGYEAKFPLPDRLALLKRCFLVLRYPVEKGKDLVLINIHNSTYDTEGNIRTRELRQLETYVEMEYSKGNFVVIGGDWNINPPGFDPAVINTEEKAHEVFPPVDTTFLSGWTFAFDPSLPTNRDVNMPYKRGVTGTTLIDYFAVSPNVEVGDVKTHHLHFEHADHNPVSITFHLH